MQKRANPSIQIILFLLVLLLAGCSGLAPQVPSEMTFIPNTPAKRDTQATAKIDRPDLIAAERAYYKAWNVPTNVPRKEISVRTVVRIAKDGRVLSARITELSGNAAVDESVRKTLNSVQRVAPLKASATAPDEYTIHISFNVVSRQDLDWPPKASTQP